MGEGGDPEFGPRDVDPGTPELRQVDAGVDAVEIDEGTVDIWRERYDGGRGGGDPPGPGDIIGELPGLARLTAKACVRAALWGAGTSMRLSGRLAREVVEPHAAVELVWDVRDGIRHYAREFLEITDLEELVAPAAPERVGASAGSRGVGGGRRGARRSDGVPPEVSLRMQGAELLRKSADMRADDRVHPAYARILAELAPDEARILRLLAANGRQPVIDVRAAKLIGVGSRLVAQELSMIGPEAGVRHNDRVSAYLLNLRRLELVEFSDDPLEDLIQYQVLEAEPHVLETIKETTRAKTIHRSLRLSSFGRGFCDVAFPLDIDEVDELTRPPVGRGTC